MIPNILRHRNNGIGFSKKLVVLLRQQQQQQRYFISASTPGKDPLEILRLSSAKRMLCDDSTGFRKSGTHWTFCFSVASNDSNQAPVLRTVNFQRVSNDGIDFLTKKGYGSDMLNGDKKKPISFLHIVGQYKPGEIVEQWRAEGHCEKLPLQEIIKNVPNYTIAGMVASKRATRDMMEEEGGGGGGDDSDVDDNISVGRKLMERQSHFVELMQSTRNELEDGKLSEEEMENCLQAFRYLPSRMERMIGGPDQVMWDRWEWLRSHDGMIWSDPTHLLPY